jgi:serine/tyrosine/threonine adenylyltransferase
MDHYDPAQVFSSIDEMGRYAYANQPRIALWNLTRLAECLLPLFSDDQEKAIGQAQDILGAFPERFSAAYQAGLRRKIGLFTERDGDEALVQDLLDAMASDKADFTLTFRRLGDAALDAVNDARLRELFTETAALDEWSARWRQRLAQEPQSGAQRQAAMAGVNPAFIPRNHRVEAVIAAAVANDDYTLFEKLLAVLAKPYQDQPEFADYANPPEPHERVCQTFCGT